MGSFWRVTDHPAEAQIWFSRLPDTATAHGAGEVIYLDEDPAGLDEDGITLRVNYGDAVTPPAPAVVVPVLGTTRPTDQNIVVPAPFGVAVDVTNLADLNGTVHYYWYETTSGSPVELTSHRDQPSWQSGASSAATVRTFYCVVTNTVGDVTEQAQSRTATITITAS